MADNNYYTSILERLQVKIFAFMDDVRRGTHIFEGRRSIEEQLSEEYHGRFLIELIQNADDACGKDGQIYIVIRQKPSPRVVVFNTGIGFTPKNFETLCTLGLTDKNPEEAIGNKGLGFRSVLQVCNSPVIYSSDINRPENTQLGFDGYCFRFDPDELINALRTTAERIVPRDGVPPIEIAGRPFQLLETTQSETVNSLRESLKNPEILERACKTLPVYEMPIPSEASDPLLPWASKKRAATAVSIEIKQGAEPIFKRALVELQPYTFLFLRNARGISVCLENDGQTEPHKLVEFERIFPRSEDTGAIRKGQIQVKYHDKQAWATICGMKPEDFKDESQGWWFKKKPLSRKDFEEALGALPERWHQISQVEIEVAVPIGKENNEGGRFSIYLPTLAKTGSGAWVNAPFYGRIDRTGIDWYRDWNSCLLNHAVVCIEEMVDLLRCSTDIESGQAILHLLGIIDRDQALAKSQISSKSIQAIIKEQGWVLCEPNSKGEQTYKRLSEITPPEELSWKVAPVDPMMDIGCRQQIPLILPHPGLAESSQGIIQSTAKIYDTATKTPTEEELALLAETAIRKARKDKQDSTWWNNLYRWLGHLDISYDVLIGKKLVWTQSGIYKVEKDSRVFSRPRRLVASDDDDSPMIKKFQDVITSSLPNALRNRVAFLNSDIDLGDKHIRSFLIREYRGETVVREFRTDQVADFILNRICREIYRKEMSKKRKKDTTEIFAWTFILWRQMRGERLSVDWNQLLIPTNTGFHPANETYAGKAWTGDEGADLEKVFKGAEPPRPFVIHPNNLIQMLPKTYQDLISTYNLIGDLKEFILEALEVWTAPRLHILKAARRGGFLPELCPVGYDYCLDTSVLRDALEKYRLPAEREVWDKYLQKIERESKHRPFQMRAKFVLNEIAYIEEITESVKDPEALARCLGRGWDKYYSKYATTIIRRDPKDYGEDRNWDITGFVVEQLKNTEWVPIRVWATRIDDEREVSEEFSDTVKPGEAVKVKRDLFGPGSVLIYSLLPHIAPDIEQYISEELCRKAGIVIYSPHQREVQEPFHIMRLICKAHNHLPNEREHLFFSLWQDLFDAAVFSLDPNRLPVSRPDAALGYKIQKDGGKHLRWLQPVKADESQTYTVWVNDNEDCLSLLPSGTLIAYTGKAKTRLDDRCALLEHILQDVNVRRLSELTIIPEYDKVDGWGEPRLLSDAFPWLVQPTLAVLAFGRETSMSVSNPKGEFRPLATRIEESRVQYVHNLHIKLEGLDVEPEPRNIFYSSSENLLFLDMGAALRLRDLAPPLSLLFDREGYRKPAELWLRDVEEATGDTSLRKDVPPEITIDELDIEASNLQELFQVIGGQTQQIIRSVAPALFSITKEGHSPLSAEEFNSFIGKIADTVKPYELAEEMMASILTKSGVSDEIKYANTLRQIVEQRRGPAEIAKKAYELFSIDLGDWNSAAEEIGARGQIVSNNEGIEAFSEVKQKTRWAACGFLQTHLKDSSREEFRDRWESYAELKPSESIHEAWSPSSVQIESPIIDWFKAQFADLPEKPVFPSDEEFLESIRTNYTHLGKDPDAVLDSNIKLLNIQWKRLRIALACLALRGVDSEAIFSGLRAIDDGAPGNWVMGNEKLQSSLSVDLCSKEDLFTLLCEWSSAQAALIRKPLEGIKVNTLDDFIKSKKITPDEEPKAEERLIKEPKAVPKQTIARKSFEIPEKDLPLDELRKELDQLLKENNQEILSRLTHDVDINIAANLGDAPGQRTGTKRGGRKLSTYEGKDTDFIGYVSEYLIYRALKDRYPHIGLSEWVSGNKEKFFPGSKGNDNLGYDFCIPVDGCKVMIEVKSHTGDQSFFELGSSELDAAQRALETGEIYQVWVIRNLEGNLDIDHIPNPMDRENRKHFRFEVGRVYYKTE
jgi:hypothetical protein